MAEEFEWIDRGRGILNKRDREILMGVNEDADELSQNAINVRRHEIRQRIENSILDFQILSNYLPHADRIQIFQPAYDWSRKRRLKDEQGRESATIPIPNILYSWISAFEFFSYGMAAGGKEEVLGLLNSLFSEGVERGLRQRHHTHRDYYRDIAVNLSFNYGTGYVWNDYIQEVESNLPNQPSEIAEEIIQLERERRIPSDIASRWIQHYVREPKLDKTGYR